MTITEQLQFSVLSAPVASLDRRALSQAWYSALYGAARRNAAGTASATNAVQTLSLAQARAHRAPTGMSARQPARTGAARADARAQSEGAPAERRAPRSPLARKIERAFLKPHAGARKGSFTIEGEHGRVHVLLQSRGTQLKLVAICPPKARAQVCAALAQARYALALRGIDLDADARSAQVC